MDTAKVSWDRKSLLRDGSAWVPVMGEAHFARLSRSRWKRELAKMRAGGITMVATYVFWIHHEEIEGKFDFTGDRDVRGFVEACKEAGFAVVLRAGPWCHGEVRNGGLPDWLLTKCKPRTDDPAYIEHVKALYGAIAAELKGLLWADGGPVVGMQIENEFGGPGEHLMHLKALAKAAGLEVPFYTRTGWPRLRTPVPVGELLPLYGTYAEGFWDKALTAMPGHYRESFTFSAVPLTSDIGSDTLAKNPQHDPEDLRQYPYLTCEIGGGMEMSYHRRVLIDARDILACAITRLGSGSNLLGYYMYHGGTNPESATGITLNESQATAYPNDVPVKSYDFQAPLGQYGQVRPHFHLLRRLHYLIADFQELFGAAGVRFGEGEGGVRWASREANGAGFLFVCNYERLKPMAQKTLPAVRGLPFPEMAVPADTAYCLPYGLRLGGHKLEWATAQLVCKVGKAVFFAEIPGVEAKIKFADQEVLACKGGRDAAAEFEDLTVYVLTDPDSLAAYRVGDKGDRLIVAQNAVVFAEEGRVMAESDGAGDLEAWVYPERAVKRIETGGTRTMLAAETVKGPGEPRKITAHQGPKGKGSAEAPGDADFEGAAFWKVTLPADTPAGALLRVAYIGDVARAYCGETLLTDSFYCGRVFDVGMDRVPAGAREITLKILPMQPGAPIYFSHPPAMKGTGIIAELVSVELVVPGTAAVNVG